MINDIDRVLLSEEDLRKWLDGRFNWMLNFYCADQLAVENADELILSKENNSYYWYVMYDLRFE